MGSTFEPKRTEKGRGDPSPWSMSPLESLTGYIPITPERPEGQTGSSSERQRALPALQWTRSLPLVNLGLATPEGENATKSKYNHRYPQVHAGAHVCVNPATHTPCLRIQEEPRPKPPCPGPAPGEAQSGLAFLPQSSDKRAEEEGVTWVKKDPVSRPETFVSGFKGLNQECFTWVDSLRGSFGL